MITEALENHPSLDIDLSDNQISADGAKGPGEDM